MLTSTEMGSIVQRLTYRPGWGLEVVDHVEGPVLRVTARLDDSRAEGATDVGIDTFVPPCPAEEDFVRFVAWRLRRIEIHESREWLRLDGTLVDDPHQDALDREALPAAVDYLR